MTVFTTNLHLELVDFNQVTWHDEEHHNWEIVDAAFAALGLSGFVGLWANLTAYTAGERVIDGTDLSIWQANVNHTSDIFPTTFAQDRAANPTYWSTAVSAVNVSGPATSTDNAIARFHLTSGKIIQNSLVTISDAGSMFFPTGAVVDFNAGNYTITHSAGLLTFSGALTIGGAVIASGVATVTGVFTAAFPAFGARDVPGGRLTLTTALPVTIADVTAAATLYYTPYLSNEIALYDGTNWKQYTFTERSLTLTGLLTNARPHDVFIYDNAGTLTLEVLAWTSDTARATAIVRQDGVWCKTGALTRRYLGTLHATGTGTTEDSKVKRFLWNMYNRVPRQMLRIETAGSWVYTSATIRQANANTANQLDMVRGIDEDTVYAICHAGHLDSVATQDGNIRIGLDSTTTLATDAIGGFCRVTVANCVTYSTSIYSGLPGLGRHILTWLESATTGGSHTWMGTTYSGISATVMA